MDEQCHELRFHVMANHWEEALPIGNGKMGAMIYGRVATEVLQLNEDSIWFGGKRNRINPSAKAYLPKIRKAIDEGRIKEAQDMCSLALTGIPESQRHYEPLGNLYLLFEGDEKEVSQYERELDLHSAVASTTFCQRDVQYKREYLASFDEQVIAIYLEADTDHQLSFHTQLARGKVSWDLSPYENQIFRNPDYNAFADTCENISEDMTMMTGACGGKDGNQFACGIRILQQGGKLLAIGNSLVVKEANSAMILIAATSTFYDKDPEEVVKNRLLAVSQSETEPKIAWEKLKKEHVKAYRALYDRMTLTLPKDQWEIVRLFNFGRYLMIAGSRVGSQPLNLQGIWNKDFNPMWGSKYTININTQMNYWAADKGHLPECHLPLFDLIERMKEEGMKVAKEMYGCRGFVAHHNTDIWGDCAPQDACLSSSYWVMGAAWLCLHIWEHYGYTGDKAFLETHFETMLEAAIFLVDFMIEDGPYLVVSPTLSPENEYKLPNGESGVICKGATMDDQIARALFEACMKAADLLQYDHPYLKEIKKAMAKLAPTQVDQLGCIKEWHGDYEAADPGHRHISHLFGLFPGHEITREEPKLFNAAKKTLERRLAYGGGHTGWSRAWIINMYARLGEGEEAYKHIGLLMEHSLLPNLFDNHPPFQIDGNFGLVSGIIEMIVQSSEKGDAFLPALPKAWHTGSLKGACLWGGRTVDISWKDGKLIF